MKHSKLLLSATSSILLVLLIAFPASEVRSFNGSTFVYPVMGPRLSSDFGPRRHPIRKATRHHDGIDLAAPEGAQCRAILSGVVVYADPLGGYGNLVVVKHASGFTSHYGHLSLIKVKTGQKVSAGSILGTVGATGRVTGPHLHFEIRKDGVPEDPERFLPGLAAIAEG